MIGINRDGTIVHFGPDINNLLRNGVNNSGKYDSAAMQRAINQVNAAQESIQAAVKELNAISLDKLAGSTKKSMNSIIQTNINSLGDTSKSLGDCVSALNSKIRAIG